MLRSREKWRWGRGLKLLPVSLCLAVLLAFPGAVLADTIYVNVRAGSGGDGSSWDMAYDGLVPALDRAQPGDEIWVASGTYMPTSGFDRSASFVVKSGVALYGGFAGTETFRDERNPGEFGVTLTGDLGGNDPWTGDRSDNSYHVLYVNPPEGWEEDPETVIDGFSIECGNADGLDLLEGQGGGIYVDGAQLRVHDCVFTRNYGREGAGIYLTECSSLILNACHFVDNCATEKGGGLCSRGFRAEIYGCLFSGNTVERDGGGGLFQEGMCLEVRECDFHGNQAISYGGGMYLKEAIDSSAVVEGCRFDSNVAEVGGGGIYNAASGLTLSACTFTDNEVPGGKEGDGLGGALFDDGYSATINNCTFSGNRVYVTGDQPGYGGGIFERGAASRITNCTFHDNIASHGGRGAGLYSEASRPLLTNCIFWDNYDLNDQDYDIGYADIAGKTDRPAVEHCIVLGGYDGEAISDDPHLRSLGDYDSERWYGPPGYWKPIQTYAFLTGSPALDAGTGSVMSGDIQLVPSADARRVSRPQGDSCDIGAYEALWYTITVSADSGGTVSAELCGVVENSADFTAYDTPRFVITPEESMDLKGLRLDGMPLDVVSPDGCTYSFAPLSADHTLEMVFAVKTFDISGIVSGDHGTVTATPSPVEWGGSSYVSVKADDHYHIASALVDDAPLVLSDDLKVYTHPFTGVRENHTVTAAFAVDRYTLTPGTSGQGVVTVSPEPGEDGKYAYGTRVTFTAVSDENSVLIGWTGVDSSEGSSATVVMNGDRTVTAAFGLKSFTITATAGPGGSISPESASVNWGAGRTFTVTPHNGFVIADVTVDGVSQGASGSVRVDDVRKSLDVEATFALKEEELHDDGADFPDTGPEGGEAIDALVEGTASIDLPDEIRDQGFGRVDSSDVDEWVLEPVSADDVGDIVAKAEPEGTFLTGVSFDIAADDTLSLEGIGVLALNVTLHVPEEELSIACLESIEDAEGSAGLTSAFLDDVEIFKVSGGKAYDLFDVVLDAGADPEAFFAVSRDASGDFGVGLKLLIADAPIAKRPVRILEESGDCRFLIFDGETDHCFKDPLTAVEKPRGGPDGAGGRGWGGCSVGFALPGMVLLMLPLVLLRKRE